MCIIWQKHHNLTSVECTSLSPSTSPRLSKTKKLLQMPHSLVAWPSQVVLVVKKLPANAGNIRDMGPIPESGRSSGEGHGNALQYSCLGNSMDREAWGLPAIHGMAKGWT